MGPEPLNHRRVQMKCFLKSQVFSLAAGFFGLSMCLAATTVFGHNGTGYSGPRTAGEAIPSGELRPHLRPQLNSNDIYQTFIKCVAGVVTKPYQPIFGPTQSRTVYSERPSLFSQIVEQIRMVEPGYNAFQSVFQPQVLSTKSSSCSERNASTWTDRECIYFAEKTDSRYLYSDPGQSKVYTSYIYFGPDVQKERPTFGELEFRFPRIGLFRFQFKHPLWKVTYGAHSYDALGRRTSDSPPVTSVTLFDRSAEGLIQGQKLDMYGQIPTSLMLDVSQFNTCVIQELSR